MNANRRLAVAALTSAGLLWGTTVPLSKVALQWLPPGWLTFARFGLAAAILLAVSARPAARPALRAACSPLILASGAAGYGVLLACVGVGGLSGALFLAAVGRRLRRGLLQLFLRALQHLEHRQ